MVSNKATISGLARKLTLFTDPVRLRLFFFLVSSGRTNFCVSDIAKFLKSSLSNTSHQLRKLELAGIVEPHREGRMVCYRIKKTQEVSLLYACLKKLL